MKQDQLIISKKIRPVGGMNTFVAPEALDLGESPDMVNFIVFQGTLRKRPGYTQWKTGNASFGSAVVGLFSTQDVANATYLYAAYTTGLKVYNSGTLSWDAVAGAALTGGANNLFSWEVSQNAVVFCNGVDAVQLTAFGGGAYAGLNANCPPARYLTRFASRLYIAFTVEGGVSKPFRVRRSVVDDHTDWIGVGSGFTDLAEFPYHLRNIKKLGSAMAVYTEKSIWVGTRTEIAGAPARFDVLATDIGNYAAFTLVGYNTEHYFLGNDDFYVLTLGAQPQGVGTAIRDRVFASLNPSGLQNMFSLVQFDTKEVLFFICTGGDTTPKTVWVLNKIRGCWYPWAVGGTPRCATTHRLDDSITINGLIGTINDQTWEFDSRVIQGAYPSMMTGDADGKVYQWSVAYPSDNGTAIACRWTSKDLTCRDIHPDLGDRKITLRRISFTYLVGSGGSLVFSYSVDGGQTWPLTSTITIPSGSGGWATATDTSQITGDRIRFKIEHSELNATIVIDSFDVELELRDSPRAA